MLMINSIELVNWRSHKHTRLDFQKGVNVLVGIMGAGKSSVTDAISFGLFGTFPALTHRRTNLDGLILNKPKQENESEIKIEFTVESDTYLVTRKITRDSSTTTKLEKNGSYVQSQPERVNEEIERLLNLDYDTFSRVIYSEQNRLDYFLELPKGDRKRQIDQMLGLDRFANAELNATSLINSIKSLIGEDDQLLSQMDIKEYKKQLEVLAREKENVDKEQSTLIGDATSAKTEVDRLCKESAGQKQRYERKNMLEREIAELESKVLTLKTEIEKISVQYEEKAISQQSKEKHAKEETVSAELKELRDKKEAATRALASAESELKAGEVKFKERDSLLEKMKGKDLPAMDKELNECNNNLQELMKELAAQKGKKQELAEWVGELSKHISKCPICERVMDDELREKLLNDKTSLSKSADNAIEKASKEKEEMSTRLEKLAKEHETVLLASKRLEDYSGIDKIIAKIREKIISEKRTSTELSKGIESSEDALNSIREEIKRLDSQLEAARRKTSHESDIKKSQGLIATKKEEFEGIKVDKNSVDVLQERITKENANLSKMNERIDGNKKYLSNINAQIEEKAKQIAGINLMKDKIEKRRTQLGEMNKFKGALVDTEGLLRNRLVTSINSLMQSVWSEIYPYGDYSGIKLEVGKDDYKLEARTLMDDGTVSWAEVDGMASGGERSMACLAMRIAMAMVVVPNLKWLILDEPTHNIDENGIGKFIEMLGSSLPKVVEQVFVITHDNELKQISSARIYQLDRDKSKNGYTKVLEL